MKVEILLIPEYDRLDESVAMAEKYHAHFEYNDFYFPSVYMNQDEIDKRVERYLSYNRDISMDTMHGAFWIWFFIVLILRLRNTQNNVCANPWKLQRGSELKVLFFIQD